VVGLCRVERSRARPELGELSALVDDAYQGRGIGNALVRRVAELARDAGVARIAGAFLSDNLRMLNLLREVGLARHSRTEAAGGGTVVRTEFVLEETEKVLNDVAADDKAIAREQLGRFFEPRRIAVVGASRDESSVGGMVFRHLLHGGFSGAVYPVNRSARVVQSVASYPSLGECPEVPDLIIVCVPARHVNEIVEEAGSLGVRAACIISAGFGEAGPEGQRLQDDLLSRARRSGMRIIGPNCMGLMNASAAVRMNATFCPVFPSPGRLAFSSQSGALGLTVLEHAASLGLGISKFVSVGNKADISSNDILLYCEDDDETDVVLLYLESFGNPLKFSRIARRISQRKPIVAVKSGRTTAGARAAASHTAALASGDVVVDALFLQTGVIRTDTLEELFAVATLLSTQPLPTGNRVAILTNAGGPAILAADALESRGLEVPALREEARRQLREFLPPEAGIGNPVDLIASGDAEQFGRSLRLLGNAPGIDIVFVIFIPAGISPASEVARALVEARRDIPDTKPVISVFMNAKGVPPELAEARIPSFAFPEDAARALGRVASYAAWRSRPMGQLVRHADIDRRGARELVERLLASAHDAAPAPPDPDAQARRGQRARSVWLSTEEARALLACYGVPFARSIIVSGSEEGAAAQRSLGGRVAVKVAAPIHKTDVGGIRLGLESPVETSQAIEEMRENLIASGLDEHARAFVVQEMVDDGVEMVVGVSHDPSFGPIVMLGSGGTLVELMGDVSFRITPLTDADVEEMIGSLRMKPVLTGYRGGLPMDIGALTELLYRISALVEDLPEIAELDLNPVFCRPEGVACVDVRLRLARPD
ncbi:MAG: GNAT family N-acetyltransferase, partial [Acidobacteriota bacterium]|nr:GNAT family N-acetyltransferase [Acidobacteriota bacterium]